MHQHAYLMADAALRERHLQLQHRLHVHALLGDRSSHRSLRHDLAVLLVRLARIVEPGRAGDGAARSGVTSAPSAVAA